MQFAVLGSCLAHLFVKSQFNCKNSATSVFLKYSYIAAAGVVVNFLFFLLLLQLGAHSLLNTIEY